jgi:hypothetical protein
MPNPSVAVTTEVNVEGATPDYDAEDYSPEELEALEAGDFDFDTDSLLDGVDTSLFEDVGGSLFEELGGGLLDSFDI